jgi:RNAse (barnase) inhibitor barstar
MSKAATSKGSSKRQAAPALAAALPAQLVKPAGALPIGDLRHWAQQAGQQFVAADLSACADRRSVLQAIGQAFAFPGWYGANLDALYDCLTDLAAPGAPGWFVVLDGLPRAPALDARQRAALLGVFRDALEPFAAAGVPLRVFYR